MKKAVFVSALILAVYIHVSAQEEKKMAAGLGAELNMNSREMFAGGLALSFDYNLPVSSYPSAVGFTVTCSYNFKDTNVAEFAAFFRWYLQEEGHQGWFIQAEAGYTLISEEGDGNLPLPFLAGLRTGYRLPLGASFFAEPYVRFGYSFLFGIGVIGGMRF